MGKNIAIAGLVVVAVSAMAFGAVFWWKALNEKARADGLSEYLTEMKVALAEQGEESRRLEREIEEMRGASAPTESTGTGVEPAASSEAKPKDGGNPFAKMMKGLSDDPAMKEMMAGQQKFMVDMVYGPLLENLDLTEEQKEELRALLGERQIALMEQGLQFMDGSLSKDEKQALAMAIADRQKEWSSRISDMIGEENYAQFDLYEKSQPERQQIKTFKDSLSGGAHELTLDQEEALMSAMYEERKNFNFSANAGSKGDLKTDVLTGLTPEGVETFIEENNRLQENTYTRAAQILSPEQLETFRQSQENFRAMQEFGMKMGVQMMEGQKED